MKFPDIFKKKNQTQNYFIGLFLKHSSLEVFLYQVTEDEITVLSHKSRDYSNGWDNITEDVDDTLFAIEQETKKQFEKVILYLHSHLVDENTKEIKEPYKKSIKDLLKKLELQPLGYIECYEAVISYLEKRDHTLLNAILVELDKDEISMYLYMGGRQVYRSSFEKTAPLVDHLDLEFAKIKKNSMLPSRLILFGEHEYQKEVDEVCAHEFENKHFIQMPKVELFSQEELARSLSDTFKDQLLHKAESLKTEADDKVTEYVAPDENFEIVDHTTSPTAEPKKEVMGFVIGDDVAEKSEADFPNYDQTVAPQSEGVPPAKSRALSDTIGVIGAKISHAFTAVKRAIPANQRKVPYAIAAGVVAVLVGVFSIEYFFHKAELTVYFPSQSIKKDLSIPAVLGDNEINLRVGTVSAQVSDKKTTTGKQDVGEKAKGKVTIHNFDDREHVFSKGTALKAENQSFVLDQEVKVASASEVLIAGGYVKQPGKAQGAVVAAVLGPEGNLDKGKKFQIEDLSTAVFFAINDEALSGGTKKQIKTVAKADIDALRKQAIADGSKQAEADLKKVQSSKDEQVLGAMTEASPKKLDFSKVIGDEATEVALNADIGVTYYTFSSTQLKNYLKKMLDPEVKSGFALTTDKITYAVRDASAKGDEVTLGIDAQGKAVRHFSKEEILAKVAGHDQKQLEKILKNDFQATGFEVKTKSSPVFFLTGRMPFAKNNIDVKIDSL